MAELVIPKYLFHPTACISDELKSLEFAITNVKAETEKLKLLLGEDIETENYWEEQLKQEEKKKLASV